VPELKDSLGPADIPDWLVGTGRIGISLEVLVQLYAGLAKCAAGRAVALDLCRESQTPNHGIAVVLAVGQVTHISGQGIAPRQALRRCAGLQDGTSYGPRLPGHWG